MFITENPVGRQLAIFTLLITLGCLTPLLILIALLLLLVRAVLTLYKTLFKPDYGDFLTGMNNFFSGDSPYENPQSIVSGHSFIDGVIPLKDLQQHINTKLQEFAEKRPSPWFPEMTQYVTTWMGFSVLRKEQNFRIEEHIKLLSDIDPSFQDLEINDDNVADICFTLSTIPFARETSPWEFLVHYNVKLEAEEMTTAKMVIFMRQHHTLCDALALLKLLGHFFGNPHGFEQFMSKFSKSIVRVKRSFWQKLAHVLSYPVVGLYESAAFLIDSWDDNAWHPGWPKEGFRRNYRYINFDPFSQERVKRIRKMRGDAKFFNVVLAALTGGLKKFMLKYNVEVPKALHAVVSVPIPKAATRLSNNLTNTMLRIPVDMKSRSEILQCLEEQSVTGKSSKFPMIALAITTFMGLFPRKLLANYWIFTTVATSNFPGFQEQMKVFGHKTLNLNALAQLPASTVGIYFWCSGYMGKLFITLGVGNHIASSWEQVKDMRRFIMEELDALEDPENNHIVQENFSPVSSANGNTESSKTLRRSLRGKAD